MGKLFYKDSALIGLDINTTEVKVMSIDPQKNIVQGYGAIDVDAASMRKVFDSGDSYLSTKLKSLFSEKIVGSLASDNVVVGIPTSRTYARTLTLPRSAEKDIEEAVELEVEQYVPIPVSLLYVDYEIIARTKDDLTVIVSAVPRTIVDNIHDAVTSVGFTAVAVEPSINAVARLLRNTEEGTLPTLIVDIGPANTDIAVLDGAIRVTGGATVGGNTFTLDIAKKLGVSLENAHQLKVLNGLNPGPRQKKITSTVEPSLQRITSETRRVIRYYNERISGDTKLEQLLIVGGGSNMPGIGEYFTNDLVMPSRVASPWQQINFGDLAQPAKQFRSRYITVAGLASLKSEEVWK